MPAYVRRLPVDFSSTYVKATSFYSSSYYPWIPFNPYLPVTGDSSYSAWLSSTATVPQRINIDHGVSFVLNKIYLENYMISGSGQTSGVKTFRVYGTNSATAFNNTGGYDLTDLNLLGEFEAAQHALTNAEDPQYFYIVGNSTEYRYVCIIFIDMHSGVTSFIGLRRLVYYSAHDVLDTKVSDERIIVRAYVENKVVNTKYKENLIRVFDVWRRGALNLKLRKETFIHHIYDMPPVSFLTKFSKQCQRSTLYNNGTLYSDTSGYLSGTVTVSGVVWPNVVVRLYYNVDGSLINNTLTDDSGNFTFNFLEYRKSYYTVIAFKDGFNAIVYDNVTASGPTPIVVPIPPRPEDNITGWTPAQVTTYLWLDANDTDTLTLDGYSVGEWRDKSNNHFIMRQSTPTSKPTVSTYNGRPILSLDGGDTLSSTVAFPLTGDPALTVFIVYKKTSLDNGNAYGWGSSQTGGSFGLYDSGVGTAQYAFYSASYMTSDVTTNALNIACVTKSASAGPMFAYRNSVFCGTNYTQPSANIASNFFVVGRWAQYGTAMIGSIAEIIVFNYTITNPDRFKLEGYLANKWDLLGSLPSTHPFKSGIILNYVSKFPPTFLSTYFRSTSNYSSAYLVQFAFDNTKPLVGHFNDNVWLSSSNVVPQKLCVDHVTTFVPKRIYIDNLHHFGDSQGHAIYGIKTLEIYGSNNAAAFDNAAAPNDLSNLTLIKTITLRAHITQDMPDPQIFDIDCDVYYRYIVYRITEALSTGLAYYGVRHIEIQGID